MSFQHERSPVSLKRFSDGEGFAPSPYKIITPVSCETRQYAATVNGRSVCLTCIVRLVAFDKEDFKDVQAMGEVIAEELDKALSHIVNADRVTVAIQEQPEAKETP